MTATRDKFGRPIVVVTGMGVVTSLGAGKSDNWAKLTAGQSGIRTVTRFPIDGLKTTMAGTVDFVPVEPFSATAISRGRPGGSRVAAAAGTRPRHHERGYQLRRSPAHQRRRKIRALSP